MRLLERLVKRARPAPLVYLAGACLGAAVTFSMGCQRDDTSSTSGPGPTGKELSAPGEAPPGPEGTTAPSEEPTTGERLTAQQALEAMVAAYKKASRYADKGYVEVRYQLGGRPLGEKGNFMVALDRPSNKIRVQVYRGVLVCDGGKLWATMDSAPNQVLQGEAPAEVTIESIYRDHNLADAMRGPTHAFSWLPVPLILLWADDPLETLLYHRSQEPELLKPASIDGHVCHRVWAEREDGTCVFWIDQKTHVLRRFEFPTVAPQAMYADRHRVAPEQIRGFSLVGEFQDAELDGQIDPKVFEFLAPAEAKLVEYFIPLDLQQLGQPAPDFSFVDLEGNPVTRRSLAGKIAVIDFWATWCDPCRRTLPELEQVYQKYKDNEQVTFLAVSVDATEDSPDLPRVEDKVLQDTFKEWKVTVPIGRDPELHAGTLLNVEAIPTIFIFGPDGVVQDRKTGLPPVDVDAAEELSAKLEKLLAGEAVYQGVLQEYARIHQAEKEEFQKFVQTCVKKDLYLHPAILRQELTRTEVAKRTQPQSLKLTPLWSCTELAMPGNILVVERQDGPPRLLAVDGGTSIAEIGVDGAVDTMHQLKLPPKQFVAFLRTAAGADGRRYFLGSFSGAQQLHLTDDRFQPLLDFPKDVAQDPHAGITDVQLADLDGDGTLEMCVAYLGVVGVQNVSLEGERRWVNRSLATVLRVAVLGPDAEGRRNLACTNELGTLVILDRELKRQGELHVPDFPIHWIWSADLDGDGRTELCGLRLEEEGDLVAAGLDLEGNLLWKYALPHGLHKYAVEPVTVGQLLADGPRQWLLAGPDGSIHVLAADGKLLDRFNYGMPLTGLAAAQWDGKRVLLVATPQSVDAWQVQPPGTP